MNITLTSHKIRIGDTDVATFSQSDSLAVFLRELLPHLQRPEAVYLALSVMGAATSTAIADFLGDDRANTCKRLNDLERDGRVYVLTFENTGQRGRPGAIWAVK